MEEFKALECMGNLRLFLGEEVIINHVCDLVCSLHLRNAVPKIDPRLMVWESYQDAMNGFLDRSIKVRRGELRSHVFF